MADDAVPTGVGKTALGVAMVRAGESERPDRLFNDPYAAAFAAAAPHAFDTEQRAAHNAPADSLMAKWGEIFRSHAVIRTRFFDDYLLDAARAGVRQIVLHAAGLDTRAYRLDWPAGTRLYELDLPEVLGFKQRVLDTEQAAPTCQRAALAADLRADWTGPLINAGYQPRQPTAWLVEGLLIYLSADEATALLTTIDHLSAPDSQISFEYESLGSSTMREQARQMPAMAEYSAMWKGGLPDASGWLSNHGWQVALHNRGDVTTRYGRTMANGAEGGFVTAVRRRGGTQAHIDTHAVPPPLGSDPTALQ
jgi:methyltransferase (TIGR00027 family)